MRFNVVEAYHIFDDDVGAACNAYRLFNNYISLSRKTDPWFQTPPEAISRAAELQWICMCENITHSLSQPAKTYLQSCPTMSGGFSPGPDPTTPCHPHVNDRWCDGLDGSVFSVPCKQLFVTDRPHQNHSATPLRSRLLDERNSVSVTAEPDEHTHVEGLAHNGDPEDEQLVIIDGWQNLLGILHQHTPSPDLLIHLEMYGLHITHHSIRLTDCEATIAAIREAVQQSWRDVMPPQSVAYIHLVRPQEQRHARAVVLQMIVEIVPFGVDIPPNDVPILRRIRWHSDHSMTLETAYMRDHQTGYELLFDAHLDEWCHPRHGVQCNLHIESRIALMAHRHHLLPGSLLEIFIHDDDRPEQPASSQPVDSQQPPATDSFDVPQEWLVDRPGPQIFLVLHGLFGSSLGTRYTTSQADSQQVRSAVLHAWHDYIRQDTSVTLHMVRPQDDQHLDHLHLIVELTSPSQIRLDTCQFYRGFHGTIFGRVTPQQQSIVFLDRTCVRCSQLVI